MGVYLYTGTPGGRQPGANTVAYYPLRSDLADASGNLNNLTDLGGNISATFVNDGVASIDVAYIRSYLKVPTTLTVDITKGFTYSLWCRGTAFGSYRPHFVACKGSSSGGTLADVQVYNGSGDVQIFTDFPSFSYDRSQRINTLNYDLRTITLETDGTLTFYRNGTSVWVKTTNINTNKSIGYFVLGPGRESGGSSYPIYASDFIIEDKPRTAQEVANYYNQTKDYYVTNPDYTYSIDLANSSTSAITSAGWNYRGTTPSFNSDGLYLASQGKIWVYKNLDISQAKRIRIKSNWNFVSSADVSLGIQDANQSNYYYGYKGKMVTDCKIVWNDASKTSTGGSVSNAEYSNIFTIDLDTGNTVYSIPGFGTINYTLGSSDLATLKTWGYVGAGFEAYSSSIGTNGNRIDNIEIQIWN